MASWYSQLITTTSSRITNLQRTLLSSEADGDTEDDTHVCRVLRAYYTEKGRPFPPWLPPDPRAAPPPPPPVVLTTSSGRFGAQQGGLSSLWDNNGSRGQDATPQSLRAGRGGAGAGPSSRNPFARAGTTDAREEVQARPAISQREGSYQSVYSNASTNSVPASTSGGGGSAGDRLKQRLYGAGGAARTASPATTASAYQPPPPQQAGSSGGYGGRSNDTRNRGGGGSGGDYEERFAPAAQYDSGRRGATSAVSQSDRPARRGGVSMESTVESEGRPGLPSGPRRMGGLPNGPRPR